MGKRADIGADERNKQGFNAISIEGGFVAWKQQVEGRQNVVKLKDFKDIYDENIKQK
ncbi:MAG TPA: hypothetical protein VJU13_06645 [Candidatus Nitrosocosmicus sp.]|nr:hypothetical protein [Candidatus Nitrosocosmicus sp.]